MDIIFRFDQDWYILLLGFLLSWIVLLAIRRKHIGKEETKEQLYLALGGLSTLFVMEVSATSMNLWHYTSGNWPIILWPTYFFAILFGYQLLRVIEDVAHTGNPHLSAQKIAYEQ
jgi:hypothetical protein